MPEVKTPQERLIFALDFPDSYQALSYVRALEGLVSFYKIGWELFIAEGIKIVQSLKKDGWLARTAWALREAVWAQ